ncbi:hypothetical protein EJB05_08799, partial [Eragrostis curvula]
MLTAFSLQLCRMDDYVAALHDAWVDISGDSLGHAAAQSVAGGSEASMTGPSPVRHKVATTKVKQPNFSAVEDNVLCKAWLAVSCDPAVNTGQRKEAFWTRVCERYNTKRGSNYPERTQKSITSRWDRIKAEISKFSGYMTDMVRTNPSGMTDADYSVAAGANFAAIEKHNFSLLHCWQILKDEPKWIELKRKMDNPQNSASSRDNDLTSEQHNFLDLDSDVASPARKRPVGRDAAKAAKKKAPSAPSEYTSKMHDLSVQKIDLFKETEVERKARLDAMLALEKVKANETREHRLDAMHFSANLYPVLLLA